MRRTPVLMLAAAAACAAAFVVLMLVAYESPRAQSLDFATLSGFVSLRYGTESVADVLTAGLNPAPFAVLTAALLTIALATRGVRHAAAAGVLLFGANVSSQVLKPLLAHPRNIPGFPEVDAVGATAFPSGHATAAMSLALAAVLIAPHALRPLAAVAGGALVLGEAVSLMILNWHFPSDIVGGFLLATGWCLVALAGLRAAGARWPERTRVHAPAVRPSPVLGVVAALCVVAVAAGVALARADDVASFAQAHTAAAAVGSAVVAAAVALLAAVTALTAGRR